MLLPVLLDAFVLSLYQATCACFVTFSEQWWHMVLARRFPFKQQIDGHGQLALLYIMPFILGIVTERPHVLQLHKIDGQGEHTQSSFTLRIKKHMFRETPLLDLVQALVQMISSNILFGRYIGHSFVACAHQSFMLR